MKLPASGTDIRKPGGTKGAIEYKNCSTPCRPAEVAKVARKPRMTTRPAIKPATKSVYTPEPTRQDMVLGDWNETVKHFGNQEDAIKDFIQRYFGK